MPDSYTEAELSDDLQPTRLRPIRVRQRDAVASVPDLVHEPERAIGKKPLERQILDHYAIHGHTPSLGQQLERTRCMMDNVNQQDRIKAVVLVRNRATVERTNLEMRARADENVDALKRQVRT
jgi:hypothetical protein